MQLQAFIDKFSVDQAGNTVSPETVKNIKRIYLKRS